MTIDKLTILDISQIDKTKIDKLTILEKKKFFGWNIIPILDITFHRNVFFFITEI